MIYEVNIKQKEGCKEKEKPNPEGNDFSQLS